MLKKLSFLSFIALLLSCSTEKIEAIKDNTIIEDTLEVVPGVALVQFDSATADELYAAMGTDKVSNELATKAFQNPDLLSKLGLKSIERVFPYSEEWEERHRAFGLHTFFRVCYDESVPQTKANQILIDLEGSLNVEFKPAIKRSNIPFNDLYCIEQWNLYNAGTNANFSAGIDINVLPVWEYFTTGSSEVIVSVVDDGVAINHPELKGVVIPGTKNGGSRSFVYNHEGPTLTNDDHGTHVSGIIAAKSNNGIGICGIAGGADGNGGVKIIACQMMEEIPDNEDDVLQGNAAQAIVWGADQGAVISQNSWGYDKSATKIYSDDKAAIDYFIATAGFDEGGNQVGPMAGGVVFFAAGNDNSRRGWPANYEPVIAVGAIGPNGKKASYSNYGSWVDICAPGGEYEGYYDYSGDYDASAWILSSAGANSYAYMAGTSQACPQVSGVAALLVSHFGGQGFTNEMLKEKLIKGANYDAPSKNQNIGPMLDAYGAFVVGEELPELEIVSDSPNDIELKSHETKTITLSVSNPIFSKVAYDIATELKGVSSTQSEGALTLNIDALKDDPGEYKLNITANSRSLSSQIEFNIRILDNNAPIVKKAIEGIVVESKQKIEIDLSECFEDLDGEELKYGIKALDNTIARASLLSGKLVINPGNFGKTTISVTAQDARGELCALPEFTFLYFNTKKGAEAYPNPVSDYLYIAAGTEKNLKITILNTNGTVLYEESSKASSLSPLKVNMLGFAPGIYTLKVNYNSTTTNKTIVKK